MDAFWQFCSGMRQALDTEPACPRAESPPPTREIWHDCANLLCVASAKDVTAWKQVKMRTRMFYLCSEDCWNEWLHTPPSSPWSPSIYGAPQPGDPPPLELE